MEPKVTRRGYLQSSAGLAFIGSGILGEEVTEYPEYPELATVKDGWEEERRDQVRIKRTLGDDLLCSRTYYRQMAFNEQLSSQISIDANVPFAEVVAFKAGKVRNRIETPLGSHDPGNKADGKRWYRLAMGDMFEDYLDGFSALEIEGKLPTWLSKLPGPDSVAVAFLLKPNASGNVNNDHHGVEPGAVEYTLDFELSEELAEEEGLLNRIQGMGTIDAKAWFVYWNHDGYLYGGWGIHPRMHNSNPLDDRTYVEAELEKQLDTEVAVDSDETLDQEVLDMIGEVT
ncbi:hypothetical protein [Halomontanus rarus]|uniref:hypothetical protein n=1 Tax=Halomontanus rarus TaxID=3034020 RepID=UPI00293BA0BA|nr:hypothetical protein [Halovivax sp. KZCA124]